MNMDNPVTENEIVCAVSLMGAVLPAMDRKKRIMIIDDEVGITRLLKLNLEQTNQFEVHTENDSTQALAAAEEFMPDLVLMDVMMPGIDGGELSAKMQVHPKLKAVPIIFLTAAATKAEVQRNGGKIGGLPFLAKPVRLEDVLNKIHEHLR